MDEDGETLARYLAVQYGSSNVQSLGVAPVDGLSFYQTLAQEAADQYKANARTTNTRALDLGSTTGRYEYRALPLLTTHFSS